jgi:perosamine synthetase
MSDELALLGGKPVLSQELPVFNRIGPEESEQVHKVLDSGELSGFIGAWCDGFNGGEAVQEFESVFSEVLNCDYAISVNSNTTGLIASLGAIGLSPGDEVIVPPFTMSATAIAPLFYGGIPVFADIESNYYCLDVKAVEQQINKKTKAIIVVNLFGHPAELMKLKSLADKNNIYLIEDNAQAPLAKENGLYTGTIGHIGVFSFNRHKHIQSGEGGVCVTSDPELAIRLKAIRNHGENIIEDLAIDDVTNLVGFNFRMTELNAAIGIAQMRKAMTIISERVCIAEKISNGLSDMKGITPAKVRKKCEHVYYLLAFHYDENIVGVSRELFSKALQAEGFINSQGYIKPLYYLPLFRKKIAIGHSGFPFSLSDREYTENLCPVAERMYEKELLEFFVCSYDPDEKQVEQLIEAFNKVYRSRDKLRKIELNNKNNK